MHRIATLSVAAWTFAAVAPAQVFDDLGFTPPSQLNREPMPPQSSSPGPNDFDLSMATAGGTTIVVWTSMPGGAISPGAPDGSRTLAARAIGGRATWTDQREIGLGHTRFTVERGRSDPHVAGDGAGAWLAVFHARFDWPLGPTDVELEQILSARSTDDGATWSEYIPIAFEVLPRINIGFRKRRPRIATDFRGSWVAVWESGGDGLGVGDSDKDIFFGRSTDGGATWSGGAISSNLRANSESERDLAPTIAGAAGTLIAAWHSTENFGGASGSDFDLLYSRSTDGGARWSSPAALNANAGADIGEDGPPSLASDGAGRWIAVWSSTDPLGDMLGPDADIFFALSTDDGLSWTSPAPLNTNAGRDDGDDGLQGILGGDRPSVATDGAGNWAVLWGSLSTFDGRLGPDRELLIARSTDNGLTWSDPAPIDADADDDVSDEFDPNLVAVGDRWIAAWASGPRGIGFRTGDDFDLFFSTSIGLQPSPSFQFADFVDFSLAGDQGGAWLGGVLLGAGSAFAAPSGLCMTTPGPGDNIPVWVGPERFIDLVDASLYRVRIKLTTDQGDEAAVPFWSIAHDNFNSSGAGNTFGGESMFLDSAGGANGVGRFQGRDLFDVYIAPVAALTPQWRGQLSDSTLGAFDPAFDAANDIRLIFRLLDLGEGTNSAARSGTICLEAMRIERIAIDALEVEEVVFNAPISSATHAASTFGQTPMEASIDDARNAATYRLAESDRATLIPAVAPFARSDLYPIEWRSDELHRITADVQSGGGLQRNRSDRRRLDRRRHGDE